jgi:hypothetical protein
VTEQELKEFLRKSVEEAWEARSEPYLLSFVANDLKKQNQDYRSAIPENERLKSFAERVEQADHMFRVVRHPVQKAKVGLIPYDKEYAFPVQQSASGGGSEIGRSRTKNETTLLAFFEALKDLPDDVLDDIHVPTKAIVLLLRKK